MKKNLLIGGQERPFHFGYAALARFSEKSGMTLDQMATGVVASRLDQSIMLIGCGLEDGARRGGERWPFSDIDIADWLDDRPDALGEGLAIFIESMASKMVAKEGKPTGGVEEKPKS
jgi:hypothetical protein